MQVVRNLPMGEVSRILRPNRRLLILVFLAAYCSGDVFARDGRNLDMADLISSAASKIFGVDMADGVANLVSAAFGQPSRRQGDASEGLRTGYGPQADSQPLAPSLFTGLLKLVGLDPNKLGALALNAIIFVAQMVSNSLIGKPASAPPLRTSQMRYPTGPSGYPVYPAGSGQFNGHFNGQFRTYSGATPKTDDEAEPEGTPLSWMLKSPLLKDSDIMRTAQDPTLADQLEHVIKSRSKRSVGSRSEEMATPCIQQLVCRSVPFVWAMQRSLNDILNPSEASKTADLWKTLTPVQRMYAYLPAASEIEERAKVCREKLPACQSITL